MKCQPECTHTLSVLAARAWNSRLSPWGATWSPVPWRMRRGVEKVSATSCTACTRETDSSTNTSGMCEREPGQSGGGGGSVEVMGTNPLGGVSACPHKGEFRPPLTHSVTQSLSHSSHSLPRNTAPAREPATALQSAGVAGPSTSEGPSAHEPACPSPCSTG